jgi:hypothetical protein
MSDGHSIGRIARRYREDALLCLVQIVKDEKAAPAARASAARDLLHYSDGRPTNAAPVTAASLDDLTDDECAAIYYELTIRYMEHGFPPVMGPLIEDDDEAWVYAKPDKLPVVTVPASRQRPRLYDDHDRRPVTRRVRLHDPDDDLLNSTDEKHLNGHAATDRSLVVRRFLGV